MAKKNINAKGRRHTGAFFMFPKKVWESENYKNLSHFARSLLLDLAMQYNGNNNGDLLGSMSHLKPKGWSSPTTIKKCLDELQYYGFIVCVQRGGINCGQKQRPNLYALSWLNIQKVGYSDGYKSDSKWKVKDIPGGWKITKPHLRSVKSNKQTAESTKPNKSKASSCTSLVPFPVPKKALS